MSTFNPQPGQTVYNEDGYAAEYIAKSEGMHIVRPIHEVDEDSEPSFGRPVEWRSIYESAPVEKASAEVAKLRDEAKVIRDDLQKLREERRAFESEAKQRMAVLQRHEKLSRLDDFLNGKLTHYAVFSYGAPFVLAVADAKSDPENRYSKDLRLLSLFGKSNGDLWWKLNQYSDGSGNGGHEVIPCCSEEEAKSIIRKRAEEAWLFWRADKKDWYACAKMIEAAPTIGFEVPEYVKAHSRALSIQSAQTAVAEAKKRFDAATAALEAAQAS